METKYRMRYGKEIKVRMIYAILCFVISFAISLHFSEQIIYSLSMPLKKAYEWNGANAYQPHFIFTELTEAFFTRLQVSVFVSFYSFVFILNYQL
jgi:Sec-independent protein secretion pathway component TatC